MSYEGAKRIENLLMRVRGREVPRKSIKRDARNGPRRIKRFCGRKSKNYGVVRNVLDTVNTDNQRYEKGFS